MTGLIRSEFFRLFRSGLLLIVIVLLIVASAFFNSRSKVTAQNAYDLSEICTVSEFLSYCADRSLSPQSIKAAMKSRGYLESSDATTILGVYQDIQPHQFKLLLKSIKATLIIPIVFAGFFLIMDLKGKSFYNALYSGRSRTAVYLSKALLYFIVAFFINVISIILMTAFFAGAVYSKLPASYVWGRILLYALMNTAILAVPFMLTFVIRRPVLSAFAVIIYSLITRFGANIVWPAALQSNIELWDRGASPTMIGTAVLSSVVFLAASLIIGWLGFTKTDLK